MLERTVEVISKEVACICFLCGFTFFSCGPNAKDNTTQGEGMVAENRVNSDDEASRDELENAKKKVEENVANLRERLEVSFVVVEKKGFVQEDNIGGKHIQYAALVLEKVGSGKGTESYWVLFEMNDDEEKSIFERIELHECIKMLFPVVAIESHRQIYYEKSMKLEKRVCDGE
jgi:hypothetical protein